MESIFNIFGSRGEAVKLQQTASSSGVFLDVAPQKPGLKSDSSNVYSKKVLGDIRNTLQQTNKRVDLKEKVLFKSNGEDCTSGSCSRTPLSCKPDVHSKTVQKVNEKPSHKKYHEIPKSVCNLPSLGRKENSSVRSGTPLLTTNGKFSPVFRKMILNSPELQGPDPVNEDNYEDVWTVNERPTLADYKRLSVLKDSSQQLNVWKSPQIPDVVQDTSLIATVDSSEELPEPDIQGPAPKVEDSDEDIWPLSDRPVLEDFKRIMVFWNSEEPDEFEYPCIPEPVEDLVFDLDFNLVLQEVEDLRQDVPAVPYPLVPAV